MPLPVVAIKISPIILKIKTFLGSTAIGQAWKAGGFIGIGKYLLSQVSNIIREFFSAQRIAAWFQDAKNYLWNFNWNISDQQIEQEINESLQDLKNLAGDEFVKVLRNSLGIVIFKNRLPRNPSELIMGQIAEALETLADEAIRTGTKILFLKGYKSLRNWLKQSGIAESILGANLANAWGKRGGVISFARAWESISTLIPLPSEDNLPALPPGRDSDSEIIVIDDGMRCDLDLGEIIPIKIIPNREIEEEFTYVYSPEKLAPMASSIVLAQHQLMDNRDVGIVVGGNSGSEYAYQREPRQVTLVFEYAPNPTKPYFKLPNNQKTERPKYTISNVRREAITYQNLLAAAGGLDGYMYGRRRMTYKLTDNQDGNRGEITVWAETEADAIARCNAFLSLTDSVLKSANPGGQIEGGNRQESRNNMKEIRRVYPYRVTLLVGADSTGTRDGRKRLTSPEGQYIQRKAVFSLRSTTPPPYFEGEVNRLFDLMSLGS